MGWYYTAFLMQTYTDKLKQPPPELRCINNLRFTRNVTGVYSPRHADLVSCVSDVGDIRVYKRPPAVALETDDL